VRESQFLIPKSTHEYRPIFGVGIFLEREKIEILLVQRKKPGEFLRFEKLAQAYSLRAWLNSPFFAAGWVSLEKSGGHWQPRILRDTGLQCPLG
jgi:hypothetical protein